MARATYTIDASGKTLGQLASDIALILRGKNKPGYRPHIDNGDYVIIKNCAQIRLTGKKCDQKIYRHYTGYMGGLKETPVKVLLEKKPQEVLKKAVYGMLPGNKLRDRMIKRLKFEKLSRRNN